MEANSIITDNPSLSSLEKEEDESTTYQITVIIVPELGLSHDAVAWSDGGGSSWLKTVLPQIAPGPRILQFKYGSSGGVSFSWQQLLYCGDSLLDCLLVESKNDSQLWQRPLIFLCHGLGGVIAKRTIGLAYEHYYNTAMHPLLDALSGIIFLGTPHPTYDGPHEWPRLANILRATTKLSKKVIAGTAGQFSTVARISQQFTDSGTWIGVLSVYEGKAAKIGSGIALPKREVLVDKAFATIGTMNEDLVKVDTYHNNLCHLHSKDELAKRLGDFFETARKQSQRPLVNSLGVLADRKDIAQWSSSGLEDPPLPVHHLRSFDATKGGTGGTSVNISSYEMLPLKSELTGVVRSYNLPFHYLDPSTRNTDFYGREAILHELNGLLVSPAIDATVFPQAINIPKTFAICGPGGMGKTQIALEFAHRNTPQFDVILFLIADNAIKLAQSFADIAKQMGLDGGAESHDQAVAKNLVLGWLSDPIWGLVDGGKKGEDHGRSPRWLVVFDNVDNFQILDGCWPITGPGLVLLTSRNPLAVTRTYIAIREGIDLSPFTPSESGELLRQLTGFEDSAQIQASEEVGAKLSGLPLAITQIACTIIRRDLTFTEFLELYNHEVLRREFYKEGKGPSAKNLYNVWAFEDINPEARTLLNIISFMDVDSLPERLIMTVGELQPDARPADFPSSLDRFVTARTALAKLSLVRRNRDKRELYTHRIIQDTTQASMAPNTYKEAFICAVKLLYHAWPFSEFDFETARQAQSEAVAPHIVSLHRIYQEGNTVKTVKEVRAELARLFMDFGWYQIEIGNLRSARPYFETSSEICRLAPDQTRLTYGDVEFCFAELCCLLNEPQGAVQHAKEEVSVFESYSFVGDDQQHAWRLPQAYNEMCEALMSSGRYEEALYQAIQAIKAYHALPWFSYPDWAMMNKAICLSKINRLPEAEIVILEYLEYRVSIFGELDTDTASFKQGLGIQILGDIRAAQGEIAESLDLYLRSLAQYFSTLGPKHFRLGYLHYKIGNTYLELGQAEDASIMFHKSVAIFEPYNSNGEYSAQIARILLQLSAAQNMLGDANAAAKSEVVAEDLMAALGLKLGRSISRNDLRSLVPNWSQ